jgi:Domain of unknown function (DUF927)
MIVMTNTESASAGDIQLLKDGVFVRQRGGKRRIADPILVTAFATNDEDAKREQAFVVIKFKNRYGKWRRDIVSSSMLTGNSRTFVERLSGLGYLWPSDRTIWPRIIAALSAVRPNRHIRIVDVPGWHGNSYVLPGEAYMPSGPDQREFLINSNPTVKLGGFRRLGSVKQWQKIAKFCCHSSRARLLMAASFAAPNLRLLKIPSFGINLSGDTTAGKSSLIILACSVPGLNASEGPDTWDGSTSAYEQRALGHRDAVMSLDELSHVEGDPAVAAKLLTFRLSSNRPKAKAGQYVRANNLIDRDFRVIAFSTSEDPIWQHLDNRQRRGHRVRGEQVRMINVRAAASKLGDVFDGPKADRRVGKTTEERARKIEKYAELAVEYQGEAYRAYLARLLTDNRAEGALRNYMAQYLSAAPLLGQYRWLRRIGRYFAAIYASAALAIDYSILPWNKNTTLADIQKCMQDAMEQLIASFESGPNSDAVHDQGDASELQQFKTLIDGANFVVLDRRAQGKKKIARRLKKADGIVRRDKSGTTRRLLFSHTLNRWYSDSSRRKRLTKLLRAHRIFGKGRRADTSTREIFVSELGGKVPCYVVSRKRLRRCV